MMHQILLLLEIVLKLFDEDSLGGLLLTLLSVRFLMLEY